MIDQKQYQRLFAVAILVVLVVTSDIIISLVNRSVENEVSSRSGFIQQTAPLGALYKELVGALAELTARTQDAKLQELLVRNGLNFTANAGRGQAAPQK